MNPFSSVLPWEYKDENFFPCITAEYHQCVRFNFKVVPEDDLEAFEAMVLDKTTKMKLKSSIVDPFNKEEPIYKRKNNKRPRRSTKQGRVFHLVEYFHGQGATGLVRCLKDGDDGDVSFQAVDPVTSLKGKYVLLVCSFVPSKWCGFNAERLCRLWVLSKEIASNDNFEIVIVAKMRRNYQASLPAFSQFFSGFPNRLAVSFDRPDLCDELCHNLNFNGELTGILINPDGEIIQEDIFFIDQYGAAAFPFTSTVYNPQIVRDEDRSLTGLLRCDPSTRLYKFGFPSESITVEQLSKKLVGLYLFRTGDKLRMLNNVYRQCQLRDEAKGVEPQFEIVLFCLPVGATDPATFEFEVHRLLNKLKPGIDASSWWVCPYDNSAGLRLKEKCGWFYYGEPDALFSIGADGEFIDFCGGELLCNMGYGAYPFALKPLIGRFVERADEITLESLLTCGTTRVDKLVKQDGSHIDVKELQYKNVLLYFDSLLSYDEYYDDTLNKLIKWYPKIKECEPDFEVVFVPYRASERGSVCPPESESGIPWIVCPYEPDIAASLEHHSAFYKLCDGAKMMKGLSRSSVVAFVKGGYINVLDVTRYMSCKGPAANPFCPRTRDLRLDICRQMECDLSFMMSTNLREFI